MMTFQRLAKIFLILIVWTTMSSPASASEPFYWRDSYGRGAGTAVKANCGGDEYDAGLCYTKCKSGYHGVGPVCWQNVGILAYGRGVGRVPNYNCGGKESVAGLCYEQCRSGYKGAGPVCWGMGPPGYVECGAGYATDSETCATVTASQVAAATMLIATVAPAAIEAAVKAKQAILGPEAVEEASKFSQMLEPLMTRLRPVFRDIAQNTDKIAEELTKMKSIVLKFLSDDPVRAEKMYNVANTLGKATHGAVKVSKQIKAGPDQLVDFLRIAATITGIVDPTPASNVVAAFSFPVYLPTSGATTATDAIVASRDYLYTISSTGDLHYYRLETGGTWAQHQRIGTGWASLRMVTAGDSGELYALDRSGNLLFYKHDSDLKWHSAGAKIGFGFGNMRAIVAGGNYRDGTPKRVLFTLSNDGTLWYYNFNEAPNGNIETPSGTQIGWGWKDCVRIFAGNNGAVYCIKSNGDLMRYAYDIRRPADRTPVGQKMGTAWQGFTHVFAGTSNQIYAVQANGDLLAYRDTGNQIIGPIKIGNGWNLPQVTAMKNW